MAGLGITRRLHKQCEVTGVRAMSHPHLGGLKDFLVTGVVDTVAVISKVLDRIPKREIATRLVKTPKLGFE
jgi:hypothetical protein